jgi:hypothetical protein
LAKEPIFADPVGNLKIRHDSLRLWALIVVREKTRKFADAPILAEATGKDIAVLSRIPENRSVSKKWARHWFAQPAARRQFY